jgi:hypothetical protein
VLRCGGELCVGDVAYAIDASENTVSYQQLADERANLFLLSGRDHGRGVFALGALLDVSLGPAAGVGAVAALISVVGWVPDAGRLLDAAPGRPSRCSRRRRPHELLEQQRRRHRWEGSP